MKKSEQMMMPEQLREHFRGAVEKAVEKPQKGDDDLLLELGDSEGWGLLMNIVNKAADMINSQTKKMVGKASTWEEVGKLYLTRDISIDAVKAITDVVQLRLTAREAEVAAAKEKEDDAKSDKA